MHLKKIIVYIIALLSFSVSAQQSSFRFPQEKIDKFNEEALRRVSSGETVPVFPGTPDAVVPAAGSVLQYRENRPQISHVPSNKGLTFISSDTLYIGDTLEIIGDWMRNGPIIIYNSGLLHFSGANATILGDIYLFGDQAQLIADASTLYIPQL